MNVWIVTYNFYPVWAGPTERFLRYSEGFRKRGCDPLFVTVMRENLRNAETFRGVEVLRLGFADRRASQREFLELVTEELRTVEKKPDVIIILLASNSDTAVIRRLRRNGVPVIFVSVVAQGGQGKRFFLREFISKRRQRKFYNAFDRVVSSSVTLQDDLAGQGLDPTKSVRIPNGVNLSRFCPVDSKRQVALREELQLPEGPILMFAGLRVERKGVLDLIEAWQLFAANNSNGVLLLVGDEQRDNPGFSDFYKLWDQVLADLPQNARNRIIIHPPTSEIEKYFQTVNGFVFLSYREGMPNVLPEAMACETPLITTSFAGFSPELGTDRKHLYITERDPEQISSLMEKVISGGSDVNELAKNARIWVGQQMNVESSIDSYVELFSKLSKDCGGG